MKIGTHQKTAVISLVLSIAILEVVCTALYTRLAPESGRFIADILSGDSAARNAMMIQSHPYMEYVNTPNWTKDGIRQINSLGYRGDEIQATQKDNTYRILALGESTTLSYPYVMDPSDAWPAQLETALNKPQIHTGTASAEVINGGLNYATSAELLLHYLFRDRFLGAEYVVIHTGYNDAVPLLLPRYDPEYSHYRAGWQDNLFKPRPGEKMLLKSHTFRVLYALWLKNTSLQDTVGQSEDWNDIPPEDASANARQHNPAGFERNMEILIRNILADGATPVLFPVVFASKEVTGNTPDGKHVVDHYDALYQGYTKNKQVMNALAAKYGIPYIEMDPSLISQSAFIDHIHLTEAGEKAKAQFVASKLQTLGN